MTEHLTDSDGQPLQGEPMTDEIDIDQAEEAVYDPATPGATLHVIAAEYPEFWLAIARHPKAYPKLLDWLDQVGDAQVQAAVTARRSSETPSAPAPDPGQTLAASSLQKTLERTLDQTGEAPTIALRQPAMAVSTVTAELVPRFSVKILALAVAVAVLIAVGVTALLLRGESTPVETPPVTTTVTVSPETVTPTPTPTPAPVTTSSTPQDPEVAALALLDQQLMADAPYVVSDLQDRWTTQLSAKKLGVKWEGHKWTYQNIWNEFSSLRDQYPSALLVQASLYDSFNLGPEWYVTASGIVFKGPNAALDWCAGQGLADDYCFAIRITNLHGANAKHRR